MTNTTHEAPERIWVEFEPRDWPTERIMYGEMGQPYEPYVRADLVQAAVAAALREAADAVEDYCSDAPDLAGHGHSGAIRNIITAIRKGGE